MSNIEKQGLGDNVLELYKIYRDSKSVAKDLNLSEVSVLRHVNKYEPYLIKDKYNHINREPTNKKYNIKSNYFSQIDNSDKAYILGFLYADGYNGEQSNSLQICLNSQDEGILIYIKEQLGSNVTICKKIRKGGYSNSLMSELRICSKQISQDLAKWGCMQNKTFKIRFPDFLQEELYPHFIRGYFDGDGCICLSKRANGIVVNFAGNLSFLDGLNSFLSQKIGVSLKNIRLSNKIGYLNYSRKEDIKKIYAYFYTNFSFTLDRKHQKFKDYFQKVDNIVNIDTSVIISLYKEGKTLREISEILNIGQMTAYNRILKENPNLFKKRNLEEKEKIKISNLWKSGISVKEIQKITGYPQTTVYRYKNYNK